MKNNEFIKIYLNDLLAEQIETAQTESDLENASTELVDEDGQVIDESLSKWVKNVFTKFGKGAIEQEMLKTLNNVCTKYQLKPQRINGTINPNVLGKRERRLHCYVRN